MAARFSKDESAILIRNIDPDELGSLPAGNVTVNSTDVGQSILVTATVVSGNTYSANLGKLLGDYTYGPLNFAWNKGGTLLFRERVEVVGGHLITLADIRAGDPEFGDTTRFPTAKLRAARDYVADEFEQITGRSFVRRLRQFDVLTDGTGFMLTGCFDQPSLSDVLINGVAITDTWADYSIDDSGIVEAPIFDDTGDWVTVYVEHGLYSVPEDVKRAAGIRVRSIVSQSASGVPDRATSIVSPDGGQIALATPGRAGYETGIPEVDAILSRYTYRIARDVAGAM